MKFIIIISIALSFSLFAFGQTKLTEAELRYVETTSLINKFDKEIKRTTQYTYSFSNNFLKTTFTPKENINYTFLYNLKNKNAEMFITNGEKYYKFEENYAPTIFDIGMYNLKPFTIAFKNETQLISNYLCKKAVLTFTIDDNMETIEVWYCPDIILQPNNINYIFKELPGLPVKFTFKSRAKMSIGVPNKNVTCEFLLLALNKKLPINYNLIDDAEKYFLIDVAQKNDLLLSILLDNPAQKKNQNKGIAITEELTRKDGSTISTTKYTPFTIGDTLATFEGIDMDGKPVSSKNYSDKVLVINFWFTACVPCIKEMPYLNTIKEKYVNNDVAFLSITYNNKKEIESFLNKREFKFDKIIDAQNLIDKFKVSSYPLTLIVDKNHIIKFVKIGELKGELENEIAKAMK